MQRTRVTRSSSLLDTCKICNSCETYKILYGFERKKKHLPVEPNLFEVRSANNRSPSSYCPTCNLYMALYATIRWRKRGAYGKISKNSYYRYKKMPKEARPPFYVKKCRGEFIKDEYGTHFYEVEELTSHNPFRRPKTSATKPKLPSQHKISITKSPTIDITLESKIDFLRAGGISESWSYEGSASGSEFQMFSEFYEFPTLS